MTYPDYIKDLERRKKRADNAFVADLDAIVEEAYFALDRWIDDTLEMKSGAFVASAETTSLLNGFSETYVQDLMNIGEYKSSVTGYLKELKSTGELIMDFQKLQGIDLSKAGIIDTQQMVINEIIDAYTENGLNTGFVQPLRDILYQNVASGTRVRDAKAYLKDYVQGDKDESGKLGKYITQTAQQGVDSYTGAINKKLMDTFDFDGLIISGSLIKTSSIQCRYTVNSFPGGKFTEEQFEDQIKPLALLNGLIEGTTFKNLPFNKLHWGCRHEFTPVHINK